ncbi:MULTISPECIES: spore protease YyaC [unclassified Paenibacillus]|uniref:spore protease YyaC n=1 Tax=unclassified Paenibacillus TaxID=185978 RepID=UPI000956230B|nr:MULTISPECIES: spore protease YyaC [unclassified Paenibacillus]ASS66761.1 spore protease YyaC [Paenibacillus sp. RUD330]SIP96202.1 putative sporulation protein YyaC [Paenibacillus sp. RU4X]SIQ14708.1 putative sporulation protein YyaC [Paenibacillus sp. RU4T]
MKRELKQIRPEDAAKWARVDGRGLETFFESVAGKHPLRDEVVFLCIGSDRSTGDSLGPLAGSMLREKGFPRVTGTLEQPCDSEQVGPILATLSEAACVIAIDACLGRSESTGLYLVRSGPLQPGQAIGQQLPPVGDYSVAAVVNTQGHKPYWIIQTTSLYRVIGMAQGIADAAAAAWPAASSDMPEEGGTGGGQFGFASRSASSRRDNDAS